MSVRDQWNMVCAECGEDDGLEVQVKVFARLVPDGTDIDGGDHEWEDSSACNCIHCGWSGTAKQASDACETKE
jgi:hypothetical protein